MNAKAILEVTPRPLGCRATRPKRRGSPRRKQDETKKLDPKGFDVSAASVWSWSAEQNWCVHRRRRKLAMDCGLLRDLVSKAEASALRLAAGLVR